MKRINLTPGSIPPVPDGLSPSFLGSRSGEAWAVVWKGDGQAVRDFLLSFGLSTSAEAAMAKVEQRLRCDPQFRRQHGGGVFYPVALHLNVPVPPAGRTSWSC